MVITFRLGMESSSCSNLSVDMALSLGGMAPRSCTIGPCMGMGQLPFQQSIVADHLTVQLKGREPEWANPK